MVILLQNHPPTIAILWASQSQGPRENLEINRCYHNKTALLNKMVIGYLCPFASLCLKQTNKNTLYVVSFHHRPPVPPLRPHAEESSDRQTQTFLRSRVYVLSTIHEYEKGPAVSLPWKPFPHLCCKRKAQVSAHLSTQAGCNCSSCMSLYGH